MAKCILMSIKPKYVSMILNKTKTIEVRKRFPSDYVGWVYIYCTKDKQLTLRNERYALINGEKYHIDSPVLNGKAVARFWCDKVEEILNNDDDTNSTKTLSEQELLKKSCLTEDELVDYLPYGLLNDKVEWVLGKAIHITKLEIFDKPKEIGEFKVWQDCGKCWHEEDCDCEKEHCFFCKNLTRAPQSWQYIEVDL